MIPTATNIVLHTSNLTTGYASKKEQIVVSKNVTVQLEKGKLIALIGANGIGKSTLLRTLSGIQKPLSGEVYLNKIAISNYDNLTLAQNLSLVLTEKLPANNLTVFDLVALGRQPHTNWIGSLSEMDIEKINEALFITKLGSLQNKKHTEISDGQLQKALVARALAQDAPLIILDEPTTHLDLVNKISLLKLLQQLTKQTNKCILFSSHDIDLAIQMADEMIVITDKITIQNTPCKLIEAGIFDQLFDDELVFFDKSKGKFIVR